MSVSNKKIEISTAAGLSLAAGIIIVIGSSVSSFWHTTFFPHMVWMMGQQFTDGIMVLSLVGIVFGAVVIVGAILMFKKPLQTRQWGVIVLVASALSFIGMGGFMIGAILGVIAGVIALTKNGGAN
jgi:hypothetical protein